MNTIQLYANKKMKNYRFIEKEGLEIEITDGTILKMHFLGRDKIVVTRKYEDGESVALYSNYYESFYNNKRSPNY